MFLPETIIFVFVSNYWTPKAPNANPWDPHGPPMGPNALETVFGRANVLKPSVFTARSASLELVARAPGSARSPGSGVSKCCSDLPSTRAGGQDDGS